MNLTIKMIVVLSVMTMVAGGLLSSWDGITRPRIEAYRLEQLKLAISEVLPQFDNYDELKSDEITLYIAKNPETPEPVGISFEAVGNGFQGKISIMVGVATDFSQITGIKILEQIETPGLGTKIVTDPSRKDNPFWFPDQFKGLKTQPSIGVVKNIKPTNPTDIQAITGATISSQAVVRIINTDLQRAKSIYQSKIK
jgi:electron transport complex protein RnfG